MSYELIVIGAGPGGLTAGIYGGRAGLSTLIIEKEAVGGLPARTALIENYPGFRSIAGHKLMTEMKEHASKYAVINELEAAEQLERKNGLVVKTTETEYTTKALILATGTTYRKLNVKGETEFLGRGVSYCPTCDGPLFKGKKVLVVGGGNSAVTEALYLMDIGANVTLMHRRNELRAEKALQERLFERNMPVLWNTVLNEIKGDKFVEGIIAQNTEADTRKEMPFDGVFVSIGEVPNNELAKQVGAGLDARGYIATDKTQRSNVPMVYAAGDITGGVKQIVVACAEGAAAALSAHEDSKNPYWAKRK